MSKTELVIMYEQAGGMQLRILKKYWDFDDDELEKVAEEISIFGKSIGNPNASGYDCDKICSLIKTQLGNNVTYDEIRNAK